MPLLFAIMMTTLLTVLVPAPAIAQEKTFGVSMGFPASVGVFWKVSDRIVVRPEFTFSKIKTDDDPTTWAVGTGVSGLIYLRTDDPLRLYVAPRFTYQRQDLDAPGFFTIETATNLYSLSGLFGAQYLLGDRFIVFGELGVRGGYSSARETITGPTFSFTSEPTGYTLGTTGGVGIVLLF